MDNGNSLSQDGMKEYLQEEERNILKIAVAQMNIHVFVYDIPLKKLYFFSSNTHPFGVLEEAEYSVDEIVEKQIIDSEYVTVFLSLFELIDHGGKNPDGLVKLHYNGSEDIWNHIMLINYFNCDGKPIRAIGTIQDVSKRMETELRYTKEKQYRQAMMADSRRVYEINVTKDRFIKLESIQDSTDYNSWNLYSETMAKLCEKNVYEEDWDVFFQIAKRENLLNGYYRGVTEFYCEYRFVDDDGTISWASSATHLLKDPLTGDVKGFIYVKDIDKQKKLELELYQRAERDSLTGIYNRSTAEQGITQILNLSDETQLHGFLMIDFDDFKLVNDNFGHAKGDFLLKQMAQCISEIVGGNGIFARVGGDEFVVFLKNAESMEQILHTANSMCNTVSGICLEDENNFRTTVSIGIASYPENGKTFAELYKKADQSLYYVKAHGKNRAFIFSDSLKNQNQ